MKYKLAIFDFDGTLADSFPFILSIIDYLADKYHLSHINPEEISELRKMHTRDLMRQFKVPMWKLPLMGRNVSALMIKNSGQIQLFEGIDAVLRDLADLGIILVLVSSNSIDVINKVLGSEITSLFSHFECGSALFGKKRRFKKVLQKFDMQPSDVISIGDEIRDLEASQKMNIPFGAVSWGYTDPKAFETYNPNYVFHSVNEITTILTGV